MRVRRSAMWVSSRSGPTVAPEAARITSGAAATSSAAQWVRETFIAGVVPDPLGEICAVAPAGRDLPPGPLDAGCLMTSVSLARIRMGGFNA